MISRLIRRFRAPSRPPPLPIPPQPEYERDWAIGDRAECIAGSEDGGWVRAQDRSHSYGPKKGQVLRVRLAYAADGTVWLVFAEFGRMSYPAGHFRKLRPCSTDFREQLRRRAPIPAPRPIRVPAPRAIPELVP